MDAITSLLTSVQGYWTTAEGIGIAILLFVIGRQVVSYLDYYADSQNPFDDELGDGEAANDWDNNYMSHHEYSDHNDNDSNFSD